MAILKYTNAAETKYGTASADSMYGYGGNDSLYGRAGDDQIWGGLGIDKLWGEDGNDTLRGEDGNDFAYGGNGNDSIFGGIGDDSLYGDAGTDTIRGEAGNDLIKGGTGISYLYGGDGNDSLYYDPTTSNISSLGAYLSQSILDGDGGTDTLNLYNNATFTYGVTQRATSTEIYMVDSNFGNLYFETTDGSDYIYAGKIYDFEKITVTGGGPLFFSGSLYAGKGHDVTGTKQNDWLVSFDANDILRGGEGDDDFTLVGGIDTVISEKGDADRFYFRDDFGTTATITGFNGAGAVGGDRIFFEKMGMSDKPMVPVIKESLGSTYITVDLYERAGDPDEVINIKIDAVGLKEGIDYFFI